MTAFAHQLARRCSIPCQKLMDKNLDNNQKRMAELEAANRALQTQLADAHQAHQQTKQALLQLQSRYPQPSNQTVHLVLDNMPEAAFWKDRNSIYLGCNQHFSQAAGLSSPEEIYPHDYKFSHPPTLLELGRKGYSQVLQADLTDPSVLL